MGELTKHYEPEQQYPNPQYAELGGWNPTQNDSAPDTNEFFVVKNLRMQTRGQYQIRSGYAMFEQTGIPAGSIVLSKSEYNCDYNDGTFDRPDGFDVTLYYDAASFEIKAIFFNKVTQKIQVTVVVASGITDDPQSVMASGTQYESYFEVTVYNHGLYTLYPKDTTKTRSTNASDWTVFQNGKDLAFGPFSTGISVLDSTTGDLLVRAATVGTNGTGPGAQVSPSAGHQQVLTYQPGLTEPPISRLPIQAKYWLTTSSVFAGTNVKFKVWEWNQNDPTNYNVSPSGKMPIEGNGHLQTNAWGYRVVFVRQYTDVHGNTITYRSQASSDFWVPNRYYTSAFLGYDSGPFKGRFAGSVKAGGTPNWRNPVTSAPFQDAAGVTDLTGLPTNQDLLDLQTAYRKFYHADLDANGSNGVAGIPNVYVPVYLGWTDGSDDSYIVGNSPYVIPVSAYDLKKAPMTVFDWLDFSSNPAFPTDVIKVEIYRTAFNGTGINDPVAKFGNGDPLFQPHLYGYVGSVEKDGQFVDDVSDALGPGSGGSAIDFSKSPERYDGYLAGQFSGKVIREYNDKLALGNIVSKYWVFAPEFVQQSVAELLNPHTGTIPVTDITGGSRTYFYQYEDDNGNVSDITLVTVMIDAVLATVLSNIYFKIPKGYAPSVTKINIICYDNTGLPGYYLIQQVSVGVDFYNYDVSSAYLGLYAKVPTTSPGGTFDNVKKSTETGGIVYGNANQIQVFPPGTNTEIINKIYGITAMESILGRLWVWTTRTLNLTVLNRDDPQGEEETVFAGNLGFNSLMKSNKIVFFVSAHGLYFAESSGIVPYPLKVQNEILPYLNEMIYDQTAAPNTVYLPSLANASRCAVSWLGQRDELWVHFPSSLDLWISLGWSSDPLVHPNAYDMSLPERTFIYKLWHGRPDDAVNYEFELINSIVGAGPAPPNPIIRPVIFRNHTDGTLYSAYFDPTDLKIIVMNNDVDQNQWEGAAYAEKRYALGFPTKRKKLRAVAFRADGRSKVTLVHGRPYPQGRLPQAAGTPDYYGEIYKGGQSGGVNKYPLHSTSLGVIGNPQTYRKRVRGINTAESKAYIMATRLTMEKDGFFPNTITLYSMGAYLTLDDHP